MIDVAPAETEGVPPSDKDALADGNEAEAETVAPTERLGLPYSDMDAARQRVSVQPKARVIGGEDMTDPEMDPVAPSEIV